MFKANNDGVGKSSLRGDLCSGDGAVLQMYFGYLKKPR